MKNVNQENCGCQGKKRVKAEADVAEILAEMEERESF